MVTVELVVEVVAAVLMTEEPKAAVVLKKLLGVAPESSGTRFVEERVLVVDSTT